ncbi:hypothetical protein T439DRAFT_320392 [Meredithblackwellia eburnea MCA 4105]
MSSTLELIKYDPTSEIHIQELKRQRVLCGWGLENVEMWTRQVAEGEKGLYWIFPPPSLIHLYPLPSQDHISSEQLTEVPLDPNPEFRALGHISLDWIDYDGDETLANREEKKVTLATFYILKAAQGRGVGRSAMDAVEELAVSPEFAAKVITLNTCPVEDLLNPEWCRKHGQPLLPEKQCMQRWYERRGYVVYGYRDRPWWTDPATGKKVGMRCVNMSKTL